MTAPSKENDMNKEQREEIKKMSNTLICGTLEGTINYINAKEKLDLIADIEKQERQLSRLLDNINGQAVCCVCSKIIPADHVRIWSNKRELFWCMQCEGKTPIKDQLARLKTENSRLLEVLMQIAYGEIERDVGCKKMRYSQANMKTLRTIAEQALVDEGE
jgi:hypothetical protein